MRIDELKDLMRAWGLATVNRYAYSRGDRTIHVLTKVRDHAPGKRADRELVRRDGASRRRMMAGKAQVKGLDIVPMWACSPITAANDADHPHDNPEIAVDQGIPDNLRWVDVALAKMRRESELRAIIVHTEYTESCSQGRKAAIACRRYEEALARRLGLTAPASNDDQVPALTLRQYRYELGRALDWLLGRQAA